MTEQIGFDPNKKDIYGKSFNDYCNIATEKYINGHYMVERQLENNKFYVPDSSEFYVGFEYVYNVGTASMPNWQESFMIDEAWQIENIVEELPYYIRVKYLDIEDIEELGFIHKYTDHKPEHLGSEPFAWGFIKTIKQDNSYKLLYNFETNTLKIEAEYVKGVLFNGFIKNKSELKKLLTQLGIESNNK